MATESTRVDVKERRSFTLETKRRIVEEYRAATNSTERGEVLRREQLYQSHVFKWGQQIDAGTLGERSKRTVNGPDVSKARVRELEAQLESARTKIDTLEELVCAQGKCLALHVDPRIHVSANSPNN